MDSTNAPPMPEALPTPTLLAPGTTRYATVTAAATGGTAAATSAALGTLTVYAYPSVGGFDIDTIEASTSIHWTEVLSINHIPLETAHPILAQWSFRVTGITGSVIGQPDYMGVYYRFLRDGQPMAFAGPIAATVGLPSVVKDWHIDPKADATSHFYSVEIAVVGSLTMSPVTISNRNITLADL